MIKTQLSGIKFAELTFLGLLVGSLVRVAGGYLADKLRGSVKLWSFWIVIAAAALSVFLLLPHAGSAANFWVFFALFMILFTATGLGSASTFRICRWCTTPSVDRLIGRPPALPPLAVAKTNKEAAALGFILAVATYGTRVEMVS